VVLDTGVLLAALDANDPRHREATAVLAGLERDVPVVPAPILSELDYCLRKRGAAATWTAFCKDVVRGRYAVHHLDPDALLRAASLQAKYADLPIGFVDAAVFVTCVELEDPQVATFDRRHFSVLRTEDGRTLEIVP
jgi:predicted nucleic acid-binding protein